MFCRVFFTTDLDGSTVAKTLMTFGAGKHKHDYWEFTKQVAAMVKHTVARPVVVNKVHEISKHQQAKMIYQELAEKHLRR